MKRSTSFDPRSDLIYVHGRVLGPRGNIPLRLVVDTAAAETLLSPEVVERVGYNPRDAERPTSVYSAIGKEQGYILRVRGFTTLGFSRNDFPVHVFDLPERYGFDGLIGLSFLRAFNYEIRSAEGKILVEPIVD